MSRAVEGLQVSRGERKAQPGYGIGYCLYDLWRNRPSRTATWRRKDTAFHFTPSSRKPGELAEVLV